MREVLVTGSSGLVGSRVVELLKDKYDFLTPDFPEFDLTKPETIQKYLTDIVIHFAAYTNVNEAETNKDLCWQINVDGTKNLLSSIDSDKTHFIYISTDMIFPGTDGPYAESDTPASIPEEITWYAWTKLQAEKLLDLDNSSIVRIIYPVRSHFSPKLDYLRGPLKKFDDGKLGPLFSDQQVSLTFIDELAKALDKIIQSKSFGIHHVSSPNTGTPHEVITYLLKKSRNFTGEISQSSVRNFPPSRYAWKGGLKSELTQQKLGISFSTWQSIIDQLIDQHLSTS